MTNKANTLTNVSIIVGVLGVAAFVLEWSAFLGVTNFPPNFWFNNALVLLLVAIWLKVGAIYHKQP